jgi:hypothetical protein
MQCTCIDATLCNAAFFGGLALRPSLARHQAPHGGHLPPRKWNEIPSTRVPKGVPFWGFLPKMWATGSTKHELPAPRKKARSKGFFSSAVSSGTRKRSKIEFLKSGIKSGARTFAFERRSAARRNTTIHGYCCS